MNRFLYSSRSALVLFGLLSVLAEEVNAQVAVVAFSPVSGLGVPISPWLVGFTATVLAVLAYRGFRGGMSRTLCLATVTAAALSCLGGGTLSFPAANALVMPATNFDLVWPSPTTSPTLEYAKDIAVHNATGEAIRIESVVPGDRFFWFYPPTSSPACSTGLTLAPEAICYVHMANDFSS